MVLTVMYPRLLDQNMALIRRIEPVSGSLDLNLDPLSGAELELKPGDSIPERSWVAMYTEHGLAGIFRSKPQRDRYGERSTSVSLVHGATELNDFLTGKSDQAQAAANTVISTIFSAYNGTHWVLGTVSPTASVVYSLNNSGVLDALVDIMEQLPGYMISFDQSVHPWRLNVIERPSEVTAQGRLSRNIQSVEISRDDSSLCTRVYYGDGSSYVQDDAAVAKYGVIEHRISDSSLTSAQLQTMANLYLDSHKAPKLSVTISAIDLSRITGEPLDQITLGSRYRLAIPDAETEENQIIEQIVCAVRYNDLFGDPNPQITLASDPETIVTFLKRQRRSGGAARQIAEEEAEKQYQHWVTENEVYKQSVYKILGVELNPDGTVKYQTDPVTGEVIVDDAGNPIPVYNEESDGSIAGQVIESATSLSTLYTKTGVASLPAGVTNLFTYTSAIKQTADSISTEVTAARGTSSSLGDRMTTLSSSIQQEADKISLVVTSTTHDGHTTNSINTAGIIVAINGGGQGASSTTISADKIALDGTVIAGYLEGGSLDVNSITAQEVWATDLIFDTGGETGLETAFYTTTLGNKTNPQQIRFLGENSDFTQAVTITYADFPHAHSVTVNDQTGGVTLGDAVDVGDSSANFNIADTVFYQSHVGIASATLFAYSDDPLDYADWTKDATGTLVNKYGLFKVVTNKDPNDFYFIGVDASSGTGGTASIDNITAQSITTDQTRSTVTIKASGTNVSDYTEDAVLSSTTYTDGSYTYPCVNLTLDNTVIGRISTQDTYVSGQTAGKNATNVVKGTWNQGSITYTTDAPSPNANAPKTLTLTWNNGGSWVWTTVDDAGVYQKQVQVKDGTTAVLTDYIDLPDTKVAVENKTQQSSWWKTTGSNAYKYVVPAFTATDYLLSDSSNQHSLATGTNNPTVIDPSEAIDYGKTLVSVTSSFTTFSGTPVSPETLNPGTYQMLVQKDGYTVTQSFYTVPSAPAPADPKVSKGTWSNGQITFTAGITGKSSDTVKIFSGTQLGTLNQAGDLISFNVYEQLSGDSEQATGATISAAIAKGTATPATPVWQGDSTHKYEISATGSFTVGGQTIQQNTGSISGGFEPTDAINYGKNLAKGISSLTVTQTSASSYAQATTIPEVSVVGNGYYFVTATPVMGDAVQRRFHTPASGGSDRWARYTEDITLTANDTGESTWMVYATYDTGRTDYPDTTKKTEVKVNASAVFSAGYSTGWTDAEGGSVNVTQTAWNYGRTTFKPSAGTGSSITIDIDWINQYPGISSATSTASITLKDTENDKLIYPDKVLKLYLQRNGEYVYLNGMGSNYIPRDNNVLAKIKVSDEPIESPRNVESLSPIKLNASEIATSTRYPTITYDDDTTADNIPLQIDASDVYDKGVADGSRLQIEQLRVVDQPLTQNNRTYTLYPSPQKNVMAGIQFSVNVPPVYRTAQSLSQTIVLPATHRNGTITGNYVEYDEGPDTGNFPVVIDARNVYQAGVSEGANYNIMGNKSYGTVRTSGTHTITPDDGFDAMTSATFYVDIPRIQDSVSETVYPGTTTIYPTGQYGAMKKAVVTVPAVDMVTQRDVSVSTGTTMNLTPGHNIRFQLKVGNTVYKTIYVLGKAS